MEITRLSLVFICIAALGTFSACKKDNLELEESKVTAEYVKKIASLQSLDKISSKTAKIVLQKVFETGIDPEQIVKDEGLVKITDESILGPIIEQILINEPIILEKYLNGDDKILMFVLGRVMKETSSKADPIATQALLKNILSSKHKPLL